jgi:uncharacterized membrane protein YbhN (UPF0104 family)
MWRLGTAAVVDGVRVIDGRTLLVALAIGAVTTVCSAWRWCLVARGLGIRLPAGGAVADYYRALFLNSALPGGVLGDVHRAVRHGRDVGDVGRGIRAVVLERSAGQVVLVVTAATVLLGAGGSMVPTPHLGTVSRPALVAAVLVVAVLAVALLLARRRAASWWNRVLRTTVADVRLGLFARGNWAGVAAFSVVALAGHLATFVVAARTAGVTAPIGRLVPLALLALLAMALPLNVGGWGPREGVCAWAFGLAGIGAAQGLTVAVVYGVLAFVAGTPGAAVLLVRWAARRRARWVAGRWGTRRWTLRWQLPPSRLLFDQAVPNRSESA